MKKKYVARTLDNGVKVLLVPNKEIESVDVAIYFRVGSRCEEQKHAGISHFLEHMFFKGTKKRPTTRDISEAIDSVGGESNAFTSHEYTGYYIKVAKQHTDLAVDVLSDMILESKFEQKEINKERNVIKEEMKMYEDTPVSYVWNVWNSVLYGEQGLGRDIAGTMQSLDNIDREAMLEYRKTYYSIANAFILVVGNYEEAELMRMLNKKWAKIPQGKRSIFEKTNDAQEKPAVQLLYRDIQQANFCMGFRAYEAFHKNHFVLRVLSALLGQGMSSRLFLKVRERRGLAYSIGAYMDNYIDVGNLVVKTGTDVGKAEKAMKLILEEFTDLKETKVSSKELKKAKEYSKGKLILSLEHPEAVASMVGMQELLLGKIITPEEMLERIDEVDSKQIQEMARELFVKEKLNLAIIGPYKDQTGFDKILKSYK